MRMKMMKKKIRLKKSSKKFDSKGFLVLRNSVQDIFKIYFKNLFVYEAQKTELYLNKLFIFFKIVYNMYVYTNSLSRLHFFFISHDSNTFKDSFSKSFNKDSFSVKTVFESNNTQNTISNPFFVNLFYTDSTMYFDSKENFNLPDYCENNKIDFYFYKEYLELYNFNKK